MGRLKTMQFALFFITLTQMAGAQTRSSWDLNLKHCEEDGMRLARSLELIEEMKLFSDRDEVDSLRRELWNKKIDIHQKMRLSYQQGRFTKDCASVLRGVFRSMKTLDDNLLIYTKNRIDPHETYSDNAFSENNKFLNKNPKFKSFRPSVDLRSGDIILSRGNAFTSAAISNLGEFDTQFSHMSLVYKDPQGKLWTVEAHIEIGSVVRPLEEGHIADKNARTAFYRFDDEKLAARAAKYIFERTKQASESTGNINYDFAFDQENSSEIFCSEVASHSFEVMSDGAVKLPLFRSRLLVKKPKFVNQLGITVSSSFIPADIEVDPRFTLIGEWTDPNRVDDLLRKDAILQAMYKWSDEMNYVMQQSSSTDSLIYRNIAWPLRRVPYLNKYFDEKLPLNMSRKLVGYFGVLEGVGKHLEKVIKTADLNSIKTRGIPLTKKEKQQLLEQERLKDKKKTIPKLHRMFRPGK